MTTKVSTTIRLSDTVDQTSRLLAALVNAQDKVMAGDESRKKAFGEKLSKSIL